ncbi:hypothetical protein PQO03_01135 [Lentisphaera profundi]|uniref:AB hydrolase-1 domain-containing protein n=1 Tax=Lentisphaera profundi TaxID=1658616 RepID=A0ABY7VQU7_9BACT|nr:hypothetical protein [Lentisphaera profundi]WDE96570.1 hypothetical protein PQO03_01135 [Lentisphaera profundi]
MTKLLRLRATRLFFLFIFTLNLQTFAAVPTLGGMQFWNDISLAGNYKIQKNVITGHCRLLEDDYLRLTWGSEDHCRTRLLALKPQIKKPQVFLIHGLGRSHHSMAQLATELSAQGYQVYNIEYSSMLNNADSLSKRLLTLFNEHQDRDNYVITHSFGGILFRKISPQLKIQKAVLMAAPNQGSTICDTLKKYRLNFLLGPAGSQLYSQSDLMSTLPAPACEFITIAGERPSQLTNWPLGLFFNEKSDGIVCESRTRLAGSAKHVKVDSSHTLIMNHPESHKVVSSFLQKKHF